MVIEVDAENPLVQGASTGEAPAASVAPSAQEPAVEPPSAMPASEPSSAEEPSSPGWLEPEPDPLPRVEPDRAPEAPEPPAFEPAAFEPPAEAPFAAEPEGEEPEKSDPAGVELLEAPLPTSERYPAAEGEEADAAVDALHRILALASLELDYEILQGEEDEPLVELWGTDQKILLRDRGRLLLAVQHLMPRVIRGLIGRSVVCKVDSDDFHMIREERLRDLAQRAADDVRHRGRPKTLEPMSPDERRIVHLTLADSPGVETESHGSGLFKRVMVRASGGGGKPRDDYSR